MKNERHVQRHGWRPDTPDHRDYTFSVPEHIASAPLPVKVDLRPKMPSIDDQLELGACTGNAIASAYEFDLIKQSVTDFAPSRLFIYYNERVMEGTVGQDAGAEIRDGIKSIGQQGVCTEKTWAYNIAKFASKPSKKAYTEALGHKALTYARVAQTLTDMKGCLASGYPIIMGFSVYDSFESQQAADTGIVQLPSKSEQMVGGHAIVVVGYDDVSQRWIVRNSWGSGWGMLGYFTVPYAYFTDPNLASDLWTIRVVAGPTPVPVPHKSFFAKLIDVVRNLFV
jgi:C1A family cysteine protease